jgi:hypothetical protein
VSRRPYFSLLFTFALLASTPAARAQGPIEDAASTTPVPTAAPTPTTTPTTTTERPVRGPAVRERGGRRSRGASTASGVLMLVMLIGFMGYYVVKKLRR